MAGHTTREHAGVSLSTGKKLAFALVSVLLAVVLAGVVFEIVLRARFDAIEQITGAAEWRVDEWEGLAYHWDRYHERLGWTNLPGYRSDERVPFRVTINGQGLRADREYAREPAPDTLRIAAFGDSCTFGEEVDDDETVPYHLERFLASTEVLNFGVRGYGLGQMLLRLEEEGFDYRPDLVLVIVLIPSDLGRVLADRLGHPKPVFRVEGDELVVGNVPVPEASRQPWALRTSFAAAWLWGRPPQWREIATLDENLRVTDAILKRMRGACESRRVPCIVVTVVTAGTLDAMHADAGQRSRIDTMRASIRASGLEVLDAVDFLDEALRRRGDALVAPNGHWSDAGNRLLAEWIAAHLVARSPRAPR